MDRDFGKMDDKGMLAVHEETSLSYVLGEHSRDTFLQQLHVSFGTPLCCEVKGKTVRELGETLRGSVMSSVLRVAKKEFKQILR